MHSLPRRAINRSSLITLNFKTPPLPQLLLGIKVLMN